MENKVIARTLRLLSQLMELHESNPFKVRSMSNAARKIDKFPERISKLPVEELEKIDGIGKSTAARVLELIQSGTIAELDRYRDQTPEGIIELLSIKGLGPKKIHVIWKTLGIESPGELYYACNENRLVEAKGFGLKTQEEIKKLLEFSQSNQGKFQYAHALPLAQAITAWLQTQNSLLHWEGGGAFRRRCEILDRIEFILSTNDEDAILQSLNKAEFFEPESISCKPGPPVRWSGKSLNGLPVEFLLVPEKEWAFQLLTNTGNDAHLAQLEQIAALESYRHAQSEQEIYQGLGLDFIEPELREGMEEISWSASRQLPILLEYQDLKGCLHNHSNYSDGIHSLEEMALECIQNGYEYFGICDHSKSAFYADGLSEERVTIQHQEIDRLNKELAPFRIFKGIESDILYDGRLDYADEVLANFDFIVASVHSQLKMEKEKATERLITAVENPYTTILGHPTGRLLLGRPGYPIDHKKVIDACAANGVVLELNANPNRLDLDWRWIHYALQKQVMISINPDAHRKESLKDMQYGIWVARKGGLPASACFNALDLDQMQSWLAERKKK